MIDTERCKGCMLCTRACSFNLIRKTPKAVNRKGYCYVEQTDWEKCTGCKSCAIVCPDGCITVYRMKTEE